MTDFQTFRDDIIWVTISFIGAMVLGTIIFGKIIPILLVCVVLVFLVCFLIFDRGREF